ncbi:MAG: hypothetical protein LBV49_12600 [Azonexus sp.]|jgi:hypothetical protein|nr:hypothetical protein [Azonexus sp.]
MRAINPLFPFEFSLRATASLLILATIVFSMPVKAACSIVYGTVVTTPVAMGTGNSCNAIQAGTGGNIIAPSVTITGTPPASPAFPGYYVYAHDGGSINFSGSSVVNVTMGQQTLVAGDPTTATTRSALAAIGSSSQIDARDGTKITVANAGHGIYMRDGGQVLIDNSTVIEVDSSGFGIVVDNTTTTLKDNPKITIIGFNTSTFGNGLQVRNGGNITIQDSLMIEGETSNTPADDGGIKGIEVTCTANGAAGASCGSSTPGGKVTIAPGAHVDMRLSNMQGVNVYGVNATSGGQFLGGNMTIDVLNDMNTSTVCANSSNRLTCQAYGYGFRSTDITATGDRSFIDGTNSTITLHPGTRNATGAAMLNGGLVEMDHTTTITSTSNGAAPWDNLGIKVDRTVVPDGTVGSGQTLTMNGISGIGLLATATANAIPVSSSISVEQFTVRGTGTRLGMTANAGSIITATGGSSVTANIYTGPLYNYANYDGTPVSAALEVAGSPASNAVGAPYLGGTINLVDSIATLLGDTSTGTIGNNGLTPDQTAGGITALYTDDAYPNAVNLDNSKLMTETAFGITALGSRVDVTLTNGSEASGGDCSTTDLIAAGGCRLAQSILDQYGDPSFALLTAKSASIMKGNALADTDSTLNMRLSESSQWIGAALNVTNVGLISPSTWVMTANSTVSKTTRNAGLIDYVGPPKGSDLTDLASYKTLTTQNFAGAGGTVSLNTYLGDDSSPSDRLVINGGAATGTTYLKIANTAGLGMLTTGDGILVVETISNGTTDGTTALDAFALASPVAAGGYEYELFRGCLVAATCSNTDRNNWYLRSKAAAPRNSDVAAVPALGPVALAALALTLMLLALRQNQKRLGARTRKPKN